MHIKGDDANLPKRNPFAGGLELAERQTAMQRAFAAAGHPPAPSPAAGGARGKLQQDAPVGWESV